SHVIVCVLCFFCDGSAHALYLHSFPTRRSSDLVFETNVFGVIAVTQAMLPLLREAPAGRIVNVSSRIGSLTAITDPAFPMRGKGDRKSTRLNSSHVKISYAVFCLKKKNKRKYVR